MKSIVAHPYAGVSTPLSNFQLPLIAAAAQPAFSGATPTSAPFTECPAIGADTSCGVLIEVTNLGTTVLSDPTQGPFDGGDDTLTGIVNLSSAPIGSIVLSSNTDLFGFDGDGICSGDYGAWDGSAGCP